MINYNKAFALPNEVWTDVRGYKGLYKVSSMGRVKNLITGKILKLGKSTKGYLYVELRKNGKRKRCSVHRLVAEAFLNPVVGKDCVNHLDEDKTNNFYGNLAWVTPKENSNFGTARQRIGEKKRGIYNTKTSKPVSQYALTGEFIREWPSMHEVERQLGFNNAYISKCCLGKFKTAYGYIWHTSD